MTTASISLPVLNHRVPFMRKLVLTTGLALVNWAHRPATSLTHEQQALRLETERAASAARDWMRYGIAQ